MYRNSAKTGAAPSRDSHTPSSGVATTTDRGSRRSQTASANMKSHRLTAML